MMTGQFINWKSFYWVSQRNVHIFANQWRNTCMIIPTYIDAYNKSHAHMYVGISFKLVGAVWLSKISWEKLPPIVCIGKGILNFLIKYNTQFTHHRQTRETCYIEFFVILLWRCLVSTDFVLSQPVNFPLKRPAGDNGSKPSGSRLWLLRLNGLADGLDGDQSIPRSSIKRIPCHRIDTFLQIGAYLLQFYAMWENEWRRVSCWTRRKKMSEERHGIGMRWRWRYSLSLSD